MAFSCYFMLVFIISNYVCADFVESVNNTCNENEFLHMETGKCTVCTICNNGLGLVTWIPCTNDSDTFCGPKFKLRLGAPKQRVIKEQTRQNIAFRDVEPSTEVKKWKSIENIVTGILIGVGFTAVIVIATVCLLHRRRRRQTLSGASNWDERKSLQELAYERNTIKETGNIYVKTEDIQTSTCLVSPV